MYFAYGTNLLKNTIEERRRFYSKEKDLGYVLKDAFESRRNSVVNLTTSACLRGSDFSL